MGSLSAWHWLIVVFLVLILFGKGRISAVMGDLGKGLAQFRRSVADTREIQAIAENDKDYSSPADRRNISTSA